MSHNSANRKASTHQALDKACHSIDEKLGEKITLQGIASLSTNLRHKHHDACLMFETSVQKYRAYPVVDANGRLLNVINRDELARLWQMDPDGTGRLADLLGKDPVVSFPDESCKSVAIRAAVEKLDRIPVVTPDRQWLLGMVTRYDLLKPYTRHYEEERIRERFIRSGKLGSCTALLFRHAAQE